MDGRKLKTKIMANAGLTVFFLLFSGGFLWAQETEVAQKAVSQLLPKVVSKEQTSETAQESTAGSHSFPGIAELVPRATELAQKASRAEEQIASASKVEEFQRAIQDARERLKNLRAQMISLGDPWRLSIHQLVDMENLINSEKKKLEGILNSIFEKLTQLESLRQTWEEQQTYWKNWEAYLHETQSEIPSDVFGRVGRTARSVLQNAAAASSALLALQQELSGMQEELNTLLEPVENSLKKARTETFQKNAPSLLSAEYLAQVRRDFRTGVSRGLNSVWKLERDYLVQYVWVLLLQALSVVLLVVLKSRFREELAKIDEWRVLLKHPWAAAVFATEIITVVIYQAPSSSWSFVSMGFLSFAAAFLISDFLPSKELRRLIFLVVAVTVLASIAKLISFPASLNRLYTFAVSIGAVPFLFSRARRLRNLTDGKVNSFVAAMQVGALLMAGATLLQIAGFSNLADYLVRCSSWTVLILVLAILMIHVGNGVLEAVLRHPLLTRWKFITRFGPELLRRLKVLLQGVIWGWTAISLFQLWGAYTSFGQAWGRIFAFHFVFGPIDLSLGLLVISFLVLYLGYSISWFLRAFLDAEVFPRHNIDRGARDAVKKLIHYTLLFFALMLAIGLLGIDLTSLAVITGALGIGVGFGLQNIVSNFVSGIMLLFERPFKVGDVVVVDDERGTVKKIGLRSAVIETLDRSELIVPNSQFISEKVTNWTRSNPIARIRIPVGVAYGSDVPQVMKLLKEAAGSEPHILSDPAPCAFFVNFGDNALEFELHVWIADVKNMLHVRSAVCQEIERLFRSHGVEIPFPQRDLHLRSMDEKLMGRL